MADPLKVAAITLPTDFNPSDQLDVLSAEPGTCTEALLSSLRLYQCYDSTLLALYRSKEMFGQDPALCLRIKDRD
jgi:hypothetical protein